MTVIQPGIFLIMHRFPHCRAVVRQRFLNSESFQSICKDYQICSEALEYWAKSEHENAPDRHQEYLTLLNDSCAAAGFNLALLPERYRSLYRQYRHHLPVDVPRL